MSKIEVELQETMGSDESVANAAWCSSYDKSRREDKYSDPEKVANLVVRLIHDGHLVPLESVIFRFWIRMPIFTDRQHMTHRVASQNGLSGRYRTMPEDFYGLPQDCVDIMNKINPSVGDLAAIQYDEICKSANKWYKYQLTTLKEAEKQGKIDNNEYKRVREMMRCVLPVAGMVERTTVMNLRSFANYQRLRNSPHAQPEIREVARLMLEAVEKANIAPIAIKTLKEINWDI